MRLVYVVLVVMVFSGCSHPESKKFERNQKVSEQLPRLNTTTSAASNNDFREKNVLKMEDENGVRYVWIEINGIPLRFIFDTGASDITISEIEALFLLKQGALTEDDFLGTQSYQIADGSISEGTIINLETVKIGNTTLHNIKASIIHNSDAPLLLGQSALSKFGRVSIDYNSNEIYFD